MCGRGCMCTVLACNMTQSWRNSSTYSTAQMSCSRVCVEERSGVMQDAKMFRRKKWKYLILDEAHMIKNWKSQRWQTLLNFNSKRRLLITGRSPPAPVMATQQHEHEHLRPSSAPESQQIYSLSPNQYHIATRSSQGKSNK